MANKEDNMIQISPESYKISLASKETNTLQGDGVTMGYSVSYLLATECGQLQPQLGYVRVFMIILWTAMRPDRPGSEGLLADRR